MHLHYLNVDFWPMYLLLSLHDAIYLKRNLNSFVRFHNGIWQTWHWNSNLLCLLGSRHHILEVERWSVEFNSNCYDLFLSDLAAWKLWVIFFHNFRMSLFPSPLFFFFFLIIKKWLETFKCMLHKYLLITCLLLSFAPLVYPCDFITWIIFDACSKLFQFSWLESK